MSGTDELLKAFRDAGWMVAVHNDYRLQGKSHTFYLFTHPSGIWVKGEAETDQEALMQAIAQTIERLAIVDNIEVKY